VSSAHPSSSTVSRVPTERASPPAMASDGGCDRSDTSTAAYAQAAGSMIVTAGVVVTLLS